MLDRLLKKDIQDYKAKDLMTKAVITALPQENLLKAKNMMSRYRIKKVVVIGDENKRYPIGILTIKDIIRFLISDQTDGELFEIPISEVITNNNESAVDMTLGVWQKNRYDRIVMGRCTTLSLPGPAGWQYH